MSGERELDWRTFVNKMVYCFSCGRFGLPSKKGIPRGWKVLYQPHHDAPPGLHVCGELCADKVREVMKDKAITEPLEQGAPPPMSAAMMAAMMGEAVSERIESVIGAVGLEPAQAEAVTEALTVELMPMMMPQSPDAPVPFVPVATVDGGVITSAFEEGPVGGLELVTTIEGPVERGPVVGGLICETAEQAAEVFGGHAGVQVPHDEEAMDRLVERETAGAQVIKFERIATPEDEERERALAEDVERAMHFCHAGRFPEDEGPGETDGPQGEPLEFITMTFAKKDGDEDDDGEG